MDKKNLDLEDIIKKLDIDTSDNDEGEPCKEYSFYKNLVLYIISLPPKQFTLLSSLIGIFLINDLDAKDQIILGKFISNISHIMLTAAAQEQLNVKKDKET